MLFVAYHNRLEVCLLMDEFCLPMSKTFTDSPIQSPEQDDRDEQATALALASTKSHASNIFEKHLVQKQAVEANRHDNNERVLSYSTAESDEMLFNAKKQLHDGAKVDHSALKVKSCSDASQTADVKTDQLVSRSERAEQSLVKPQDGATRTDQIIQENDKKISDLKPYQNDAVTKQYVNKRISEDSDQSIVTNEYEAGVTVELKRQKKSVDFLSDSFIATPDRSKLLSVSIGDMTRRTLRLKTLDDDEDTKAATGGKDFDDDWQGEIVFECSLMSPDAQSVNLSHNFTIDSVFCTSVEAESVEELVVKHPRRSSNQYTDPLQRYLHSKDESVFQTTDKNLTMKTVHHAVNLFRKALDDVILSASPVVKYTLPFLETEPGRNCILRRFLPQEIYWSETFDKKGARTKQKFYKDVENKKEKKNDQVEVLDPHPFLLERLTDGVSDLKVQNLLSDFRARGGTISLAFFCEEYDDTRAQSTDLENSDRSCTGINQEYSSKNSVSSKIKNQEEEFWDTRKVSYITTLIVI